MALCRLILVMSCMLLCKWVAPVCSVVSAQHAQDYSHFSASSVKSSKKSAQTEQKSVASQISSVFCQLYKCLQDSGGWSSLVLWTKLSDDHVLFPCITLQ